MNKSSKTLLEVDLGPNPMNFHDDPNAVEIVPGVWMHKEWLKTDKGQSFKRRIIEDYELRLNMPRVFIEPEMWEGKVGLRPDGYIMHLQFDAQKMITAISRVVGFMVGHHLATDPKGGPPQAPKLIVESARRMLKKKLSRELHEFLATLKEDLIYEVFYETGGEVKRLGGGKRYFQQQLRDRRVKRAAEKYKSHPGTESNFPTGGHLRAALKDALKNIGTKKPGVKVTESDVVEFFSSHPDYPRCASDSTLRNWLRKHKLPKWTELRKELLNEIK